MVSRMKELLKQKWILAAVAVAVILIAILSIVFGKIGINDYTLYLKEDEIVYSEVQKDKSWQVTEKFVNSDDIETSDLTDVVAYLGMYTKVSADGKYIFFFDRLTDEGASLYYRRVNKSKKEPVKIAEHVSEYMLSEDSKCVTYLKEGVLYQFDMKKSVEVVREVDDFYVSPSGDKIVYTNFDDEVYFKTIGKKEEKIESDISRIVNVSEDCNTVYFIKDDVLSFKVRGKDKVKIAEDVYSVPKIYESGELYFLQENIKEIELSKYVVDDIKEQDEKMKEPKASDYEDDNEYQDAYYEYYKKESRDELRLQLEDGKIATSTYELFYFNGKKAMSVANGIAASVDVAEEEATIVYSLYNEAKVDKVKLSQVDYMFEVEDLVEDAMFKSSKCYVAVGKKSSEIKQKSAYDFELDADGKTIYFIDNISSENNHGDLYRVKVSGNKAKKPTKYDEKVYKYGAGFVSAGQYSYYKKVNDEGDSGELYINKKKIDKNVDLYNVIYSEETDTFIYMTEWNNDKDFGVLKSYRGKSTTEVGKKVYDYYILPNGDVVYLVDYDEDTCQGSLFLFKNNKSKKVDDAVSAIIPISQ
jgi:hypothetical protein